MSGVSAEDRRARWLARNRRPMPLSADQAQKVGRLLATAESDEDRPAGAA